MSTYIHFTEEEKQRAASVDLEEFLRCHGEKLLASGREKRLARDHSVTSAATSGTTTPKNGVVMQSALCSASITSATPKR